jgi:spore photoproduct lyase
MKPKATRDVTLRERKTKSIDIFRTTPAKTVCPNFYVLAHANGCAFAPQCDYCYLKSSFWHLKGHEAFTNVESIVKEASEWIALDDLESYVLNSGNLSDSLSFEHVRPLIAALVEVFRAEAEAKGRQHALLLVTKGGNEQCQALFETKACRNVIISFSVNSPEAGARYERGAATVADRLEAARRLKAQGWRVRMRIDPMIAGFDYAGIIEDVRVLAPERVTLGTLRAEATLLKTVNHGMFADLERQADPKALARYPRPVRMAMYRQGVDALRDVCPVGLCEETEDVWKELGLDTEAKSCNCGS